MIKYKTLSLNVSICLCACRMIGSAIIVVGLYAVLWGKYKEEKEERLKRKLLEIPEAIKDNNSNNSIQVVMMIGNDNEAKTTEAPCPGSLVIDLPLSTKTTQKL